MQLGVITVPTVFNVCKGNFNMVKHSTEVVASIKVVTTDDVAYMKNYICR